MVKLSGKYSLAYNGYFLVYENKKKGTMLKMTFHRLLAVHKALTDLGEDGNKLMHIYECLMLERQKEFGRKVLMNRKKVVKND